MPTADVVDAATPSTSASASTFTAATTIASALPWVSNSICLRHHDLSHWLPLLHLLLEAQSHSSYNHLLATLGNTQFSPPIHPSSLPACDKSYIYIPPTYTKVIRSPITFPTQFHHPHSS